MGVAWISFVTDESQEAISGISFEPNFATERLQRFA
jgi:hypothetical protein